MTAEERARELLREIPDTCRCGSCVRYAKEAIIKFEREISTAGRLSAIEEAAKPSDKVISEAYGLSDFCLPEACGGGTRQGCVDELRAAYLYILRRSLSSKEQTS